MGKTKRRKKTVQKLERGLSRGARRLTRAVDIGLRTWERERERSARKKRDGAIKDAMENSAFAVGRALREASWARLDVLHGLGRRRLRDPRRIFVRALLPFWR